MAGLTPQEASILKRMTPSRVVSSTAEAGELIVILENGRVLASDAKPGPGGDWREHSPVPGTRAFALLRRMDRRREAKGRRANKGST